MFQTEYTTKEKQILKEKLFCAHKYLLENSDMINAVKMKQLAQKLMSGEFTIAFCGHFSAGKSKMINTLLGENLLPSSPIPTSANLVKIRWGDDCARVFFKKEKPRLYLAPYDYEMIKEHCQDGDQIEKIEIDDSSLDLSAGIAIMDTPGVDSADDAHRISTESALHLADLIFYIMDYNHVQSELNFMFTQNLIKAGKEIYLTINQIDKHSEQEIPFADFKRGVIESFAAWGVRPAKIFYTSLTEKNHPHNQFSELKAFLKERLDSKDSLLLHSVQHAMQKILADHFAIRKEKNETELQPFRKLLSQFSPEEKNRFNSDYNTLREKNEYLTQNLTALKSNFVTEIDKILNNAYLMPFETRELAKNYLAARQPGFKTGLFFAKRKTQLEKEKRLNIFYKAILEKTKSQIEWHIHTFLSNYVQENHINDSSISADIQTLDILFPISLPLEAVKEGARLSDESVSNYTDDVSAEIKHFTKNILAPLQDRILTAVRHELTASQEKLKQESADMQKYICALKRIQDQTESILDQQKQLAALLDRPQAMPDDCELFTEMKQEFEIIAGNKTLKKKVFPPVHSVSTVSATASPAIRDTEASTATAAGKLKTTAQKLLQTAAVLKDLSGFSKLSSELQDKALRLDKKGFTVALFGAFSAGKSSFANALIGAKVLPVSPNPMTAAINNIRPVDKTHPHESVIVKIKTEADILTDLNGALKIFGIQTTDLADAVSKIKALPPSSRIEQDHVEKTSYSFLQAFMHGYSNFSEQLGMTISAGISEFDDYVALEEKSCFVEWIDLYYDCPLTRRGITLVDTPGADSVNTRHTGVAFDFIKNADAILFVTYYNHAFSRADREFLIQLGRVKESFQLDKMFFIINAIDLAANDEEKDAVVSYVRGQLIKYGIRNPYLSTLSSLMALKEKQNAGDSISSGMAAFEKAFYRFITNDLSEMVIDSSENECKRVIALIKKLILNAQKNDVQKKAEKSSISRQRNLVNDIIANTEAENLQRKSEQETAELLYYVKQRVFLRFNEFFRESFNPAILRDDSPALKKVLKNALDDFLEQLGFDFVQEMQATMLRLDRFTEKSLSEYSESIAHSIHEINTDLTFTDFELSHNAELIFENTFTNIPREKFSKVMSYFKNAVSFFEKGDNKLMRDELQKQLDKFADGYLTVQKENFNLHYNALLSREADTIAAKILEQSDDFYLALISALEDKKILTELLHAEQQLSAIH
ncbi:dynamin family protein [Pectinatus haikarae]|uniref:dynamin family protein n=1 Tax=Pectinatus haikarae TaxID=349096 RepID=UPI0018C5552A|nr:dynamin family protein [Pectinatus haikarae]